MITHFLGEQEVRAYSHDLAKRLIRLGKDFPTVWVPLGNSGWRMHLTILEELEKIDPSFVANVSVSKAEFSRKSKSISFDPLPSASDFTGSIVLAIDSAVHTGTSMLALTSELVNLGANSILSYGLVVKNGSKMIPSYFGVLIDDKDRTYFELADIPNNRLHSAKAMTGTLRILSDLDANKKIDVGGAFEGVCVGDLLYDRETRGSKIFGYEENGAISGFVSFRKDSDTLFIDGIGVLENRRDRGITTALIRWAENWGRSMRCAKVELWAFEKVVETYVRYEFKPVDDIWRTLGFGQRFKLMRKPLLYNIKISSNGDEDYVAP